MMKEIWYASYGSNLLRERFMAYLRGGRAPGAAFEQVGCSDRSPPAKDRGVLILHELFFAGASLQWENRGRAFIRRSKEETAKTLGRMYLISAGQFREVFLQENGLAREEEGFILDLAEVVRRGSWELQGGTYGTVLYLGEEEGCPIFSFTGSWQGVQAPLNPPGPRYLDVVSRGLRETFGLSEEGILDYLRDVPGIRGLIPEEELARIAAGGIR